jgi:Uma2 family endonuclease
MLEQIKPIRKGSRPDENRPRMTYAEFLEWDNGNPHVEWVKGEVVTMAPVSNEHSAEQVFLLTLLNIFVDAGDLGVIRAEPFQMKTGPDLPGRAPDILFVAKKNVSRLKKNHLEGPADLVVEIISPRSQSIDRGDKYYEYEEGGVREYWLIDPLRRKAEFYLLGRNGQYRLAPTEGDVFRSVVLKGLWLNISWLWRKPLPSVLAVQKEWKLT